MLTIFWNTECFSARLLQCNLLLNIPSKKQKSSTCIAQPKVTLQEKHMGQHTSLQSLLHMYGCLYKHPCRHIQQGYKASGINFGLSLHVLLYFVYASREGSGKTAHMCRLARAFPACRCDKYQNIVYWSMCTYALLKILYNGSI